MEPIFVYGTLRDPDILATALGPLVSRLTPVAARLPGVRTLQARSGPFPVLRADPDGMAPGLLLAPMDAEIRAALDFFEASFDFTLTPRQVQTEDGPVTALVYDPGPGVEDTGTPWTLEDWAVDAKQLFLSIGREVVTHRLDPAARTRQAGAMMRRAVARRAAARAAPVTGQGLRTAFGPDAVQDLRASRLHGGFFALEELTYRHARFDGAMTAPVQREAFISGDAVTVLPWDPDRDEVLLIEQLRTGLIAREDPNPWSIEVIAGLIDRDEPPEAAARREAQEEADLTLGRFHPIAEYYSSPGACTEYLTSYVAEADLSGYTSGIHGLATETEDIRTMVVPRETALQAITTGEARNAPLILSLLGLERLRGQLLSAWRGGVAAGGA
ncbi:NUDIX domain-containing protein [Oceanibium sediminis]|uniref:NUDIX domain-containing protein n=1 Tax=Oceanibium sediminis TaxID=2026339 RepID=UPI000DD3E5E3|nr:NUDIX domain-containing protein [Oceanibium sediminis]